MSVAELSKELDFPKNSVFRICKTLSQLGYFDEDINSKKFSLSIKLFEIAKKNPRKSLVEAAKPFMNELRDKTTETIALQILINENQIIALEQSPGKQPFHFWVKTGTIVPYYTSSAGKAITAFSKNLDEITFEHQFEEFTNNTITCPQQFLNELKDTYVKGYATDNAEYYDGVFCLSAPIIDSRNIAIAAVTLTAPNNRMPLSKINKTANLIKEYAQQISTKIQLL